MSEWGRKAIGRDAKTSWRARGFEDASARRPKRDLPELAPENTAAYHEGYRVGKRELERLK